MAMGEKRVLLVDGYNVIRSSSLYRDFGGDDFSTDTFNRRRDTLITDVGAFAGNEYEAYVVFDGTGNTASTGEEQLVAGVHVIFSAYGYSADSVIERLAVQAQARGKEVLVVTSDAVMQFTVMRLNVTRMSAEGFADEIRGVNASVARHNPSPKRKNTLGERLDPATRAILEEWARR